MADQLGGDRKKLDEKQQPQLGARAILAVGVVLVGVALAIWRHTG